MFKLGEVKIPVDEDIEYIKNLCLSDTNWTLETQKSFIKVWTKPGELSTFKMVKLKADFEDVTARLLYDMIHDSEYRAEWDDRMIEGLYYYTLISYLDNPQYTMYLGLTSFYIHIKSLNL